MSELDYHELESFYGTEEAAEIRKEFDRLTRFMADPAESLRELTDITLYIKRCRSVRTRRIFESRLRSLDITGILRDYVDTVNREQASSGRIQRGALAHLIKPKLRNTYGKFCLDAGRRMYIAGGSQVGYRSGL